MNESSPASHVAPGSDSQLKQRITEDMKAAMRARESQRLTAIRMLTAAIKQKEVDERKQLDDAEVLAIIEKLIKQRRDSIEQYRAANRPELAEAEEFELALLSAYLPAQLGAAEVAAEIARAVSESGASGAPDMGRVMALLKPRLAGRTDMGRLSGLVKAALTPAGA